jgi:hypothetical protein
MKTTGCHPIPWRPGALATLLAVAAPLASIGCGGDSGTTSPPPPTGATGTFKGTLVGDAGESGSGVVTLTLPGASTSSAVPAGSALMPVAEVALAPVAVTGTLALTGGGLVQLSGTYDASANPQIVLAGGGYGLTGNYTATNGVFSGSATFPDGKTGQWTVSANAATVKVFCGTYTSSQGEGGGTWNLVLDENNHLTGVATGAGQLQGTFTSGSNAISVTYNGGTATGTLDPTTGGGSGTYDAPSTGDTPDAGDWAATTGEC